MSTNDDSNLFRAHKLNSQGLELARLIGEDFARLLRSISEAIPLGRELSLVKTKLEEACFFAKKGMANLPENQENPPMER
jgi:hypothetical protein